MNFPFWPSFNEKEDKNARSLQLVVNSTDTQRLVPFSIIVAVVDGATRTKLNLKIISQKCNENCFFFFYTKNQFFSLFFLFSSKNTKQTDKMIKSKQIRKCVRKRTFVKNQMKKKRNRRKMKIRNVIWKMSKDIE